MTRHSAHNHITTETRAPPTLSKGLTPYGICPSAQSHRVLAARRAHPYQGHGAPRRRAGHAGGGRHRPRRHVRHGGTVGCLRRHREGDGQAREAHLWLRGVLHPRRVPAQGREAEAVPLAASGEEQRGLPQPAETRQRVPRGQLLLQAPHHLLHAAEVRPRHHRLVGLHRRRHPEAARRAPL